MPTHSKKPEKSKTLRAELLQARDMIGKLERDRDEATDEMLKWRWQAQELRSLLRASWKLARAPEAAAVEAGELEAERETFREAAIGASRERDELRELLHAAVNERERLRGELEAERDEARGRLARAVAVVRAVDATQGAARAVLDEARGDIAEEARQKALLCAWSACEVEAPNTLFCPAHDAAFEAQHGRRYGEPPQRGRKRPTASGR